MRLTTAWGWGLLLAMAIGTAASAADDTGVIPGASPETPACLPLDADQRPNQTFTWSGACRAGALDGHGVLSWFSGGVLQESIEANFDAGAAEGPGVLSDANNNRYEGNFAHGARTGFGVFTFSDGTRYQGDFVDGKYDGFGKITYPSHAVYEGAFTKGVRNGEGDLTYANGARYQGSWAGNKRSGIGIYDPIDAARYAGRFADDRPINGVAHLRSAGADLLLVGYRPINLKVDAYKPYRQLTASERSIVSAQYEKIADGDEPPYPASGLLPIYHVLLMLEEQYLPKGVLDLIVTVDASGHASKVEILKSPDDRLSKDFGQYLAALPYKPAKCGAFACTMVFPLVIDLTRD